MKNYIGGIFKKSPKKEIIIKDDGVNLDSTHKVITESNINVDIVDNINSKSKVETTVTQTVLSEDNSECCEKLISGRRVLVDNNGNFKGFCKDKK